VSIGEVLSDARCRSGLSIVEVSRQTGIREEIVWAIELDDFAKCGGNLYARGATHADDAIVRHASEDLVRERHAGQCVLLAEDNIINRLIARELLSNAGLVVEQAENGAIALELAAQQKWDLILMDMQMPVMDGLAAARAIRERGDTTVPIIAMTANAFVEDRAACLEAGMNDHVAKPVNPAALYEILMRWLPARQA